MQRAESLSTLLTKGVVFQPISWLSVCGSEYFFVGSRAAWWITFRNFSVGLRDINTKEREVVCLKPDKIQIRRGAVCQRGMSQPHPNTSKAARVGGRWLFSLSYRKRFRASLPSAGSSMLSCHDIGFLVTVWTEKEIKKLMKRRRNEWL